MAVFYVPDLAGDYAVLSEEESSHCLRVLRLGAGDRVTLTDGCGGWFDAEIDTPHPKRCGVTVVTRHARVPAPLPLHIAGAPTKNIDRTEWLIEKCTEIGATDIALLATAHSERKAVHEDRLQRIAIAAMKQSKRAWLTRVHPMVPFSHFVTSCATAQRFIAHCEETMRRSLSAACCPAMSSTVLIGPEGDFSPEEIALAHGHDFVPVTLGDMRLRTETAAVVACHSIVFLNAMAAESSRNA